MRTLAAVPGAPTGLAASASAQSTATLTWGPPDHDGGSAVTGYQVQMCRVDLDNGQQPVLQVHEDAQVCRLLLLLLLLRLL